MSISQPARQEVWVRHKYITGEMLHETYINKLSWTSAGSMGHAEVWSIARGFEVKLVCKEAGNHCFMQYLALQLLAFSFKGRSSLL